MECEDRSCAQREEREVEEDRQGYVYLVRRLGVGRLRRGGVVSCERIGVDHLAVGEVGRDACVRVVGPHRIACFGGVRDQRQGGVMLSRHLDAVGPVRQGDADRLAVETDPFDRRQLPVAGVLHLPVPASVVGNAHRIVASSEQGLLDIFVRGRCTAQEIAPHGDATRPVGIVQVVVGQSEAVVSGGERPVPILVFGALAAVELHDSVAAEALHEFFRGARRPQGVVELDEVRLPAEQIQLELLLGGEERDQVIEAVHLVASEYQLVVFEEVDAVFVDIDLQRGVVGMAGQLVVVREGDDVVPQLPVGCIGLGRPVRALVQKPLYARMGVEVGPFPAVGRVASTPSLVRIEDVGPAERFRFGEVVYGAYAGREDRQKGDQDQRDQGFEQRDRYLSDDRRRTPIGMRDFFHERRSG